MPGWRIDVYGGIGHSFTNVMVDQIGVPGLAYDADADRWSWEAAVALLDSVIGPLLTQLVAVGPGHANARPVGAHRAAAPKPVTAAPRCSSEPAAGPGI